MPAPTGHGPVRAPTEQGTLHARTAVRIVCPCTHLIDPQVVEAALEADQHRSICASPRAPQLAAFRLEDENTLGLQRLRA
eukprot:354041-Chlamydomonas_euryale.AAC.4